MLLYPEVATSNPAVLSMHVKIRCKMELFMPTHDPTHDDHGIIPLVWES